MQRVSLKNIFFNTFLTINLFGKFIISALWIIDDLTGIKKTESIHNKSGESLRSILNTEKKKRTIEYTNQWKNQILHFQVVEKLLLKDCFGLLFLMLALFHFPDLLDFSLCYCDAMLVLKQYKFYCWKTIQKLQFKITLLIEIIQHYSEMEEGLRFSHLKKCTFFVTTAFFCDPHHRNLTAFLEILVPFFESHRLHNQ